MPEPFLSRSMSHRLWSDLEGRWKVKDVFNKWKRRGVQYALQRNLNLCIPRKVIARPQPEFPHSCVCERSMIPTYGSPIFLQQNRQTDQRNTVYVNRSQEHECRNWDWSRAVPFLGIFVSNFRNCVSAWVGGRGRRVVWCCIAIVWRRCTCLIPSLFVFIPIKSSSLILH